MATWEDGVPEVVAPAITTNINTGASTLTWEAPRARSRTVPFGTWANNGALNFDSSRINDNETTAPAFNWPSGAGTAEVVLDLGAGNSGYYRGVRLCFDTTSVAVAPYTISYSADGSAWFAVTPTSTVSSTSGVYAKRVPQWATPASAVPRYWKIARASGTLASVITEAWFFTFEASAATVEEVRVYDVNAVCMFVPGGAITTPLNVTPFVDFNPGTWENGGSQTLAYNFTIKSYDGTSESTGTPFAATDSAAGLYPPRLWARVERQETNSTLVVGNNNDLNITGTNTPYVVRLPDPGGNATITGIATEFAPAVYWGGIEVTLIHEEARLFTFNHDSASSAAGNRIKMLAGANVTMNGPFVVKLLRVDGATSYWRWLWGRESTGFK